MQLTNKDVSAGAAFEHCSPEPGLLLARDFMSYRYDLTGASKGSVDADPVSLASLSSPELRRYVSTLWCRGGDGDDELALALVSGVVLILDGE